MPSNQPKSGNSSNSNTGDYFSERGFVERGGAEGSESLSAWALASASAYAPCPVVAASLTGPLGALRLTDPAPEPDLKLERLLMPDPLVASGV
jgi:hypothetical protein